MSVNNDIGKILNLYTSRDDMRQRYLKPFIQGGCTIATDGFSVIKINGVIDGYNELDSPNAVALFSNKGEFVNNIDVDSIKNIIENIPLEVEFSETEQITECDECCGSGEVDWEYKSWTKDMDCPKCDGEGVINVTERTPTGRMIRDQNKFIQVCGHSLRVKDLEALVATSIFFKSNLINLCRLSHNVLNFEINRDVEVLISLRK